MEMLGWLMAYAKLQLFPQSRNQDTGRENGPVSGIQFHNLICPLKNSINSARL